MILERDRWTCQLCYEPIDPTLCGGGRNPHPKSAQVHHVLGKEHGDDPRYLQAAHRECNLKARVAPRPKRVSRW